MATSNDRVGDEQRPAAAAHVGVDERAQHRLPHHERQRGDDDRRLGGEVRPPPAEPVAEPEHGDAGEHQRDGGEEGDVGRRRERGGVVPDRSRTTTTGPGRPPSSRPSVPIEPPAELVVAPAPPPHASMAPRAAISCTALDTTISGLSPPPSSTGHTAKAPPPPPRGRWSATAGATVASDAVTADGPEAERSATGATPGPGRCRSPTVARRPPRLAHAAQASAADERSEW